jgi:hypothetical protein
LVLINDADWELCGGIDYQVERCKRYARLSTCDLRMCAWGAWVRGSAGQDWPASGCPRALPYMQGYCAAGARRYKARIHFASFRRCMAGRSRHACGKGGGGGETGSEDGRWTRSIGIRHGRLHQSLSPIPPTPTRAHLPDGSVRATCSGGSKDCAWHVEGSIRGKEAQEGSKHKTVSSTPKTAKRRIRGRLLHMSPDSCRTETCTGLQEKAKLQANAREGKAARQRRAAAHVQRGPT